MVVVAVPSDSLESALGAVTGLFGQITIDATNALAGRDEAFESLAHHIKSIIGGRTAKSFNVNFAALYGKVAEQRVQPGNLYAADADAEDAVVGLIGDAGYAPVRVGDLDRARALEEQAAIAFAIYEAGMGEFFYRYAPPGEL